MYNVRKIKQPDGLPYIESGVPISLRTYGGGRVSKWKPFLLGLNYGDSFEVPRTQAAALYAKAKTMKIKLTTRTIDKKNVRVWRVK